MQAVAERVKGILLSPATEWHAIALEPASTGMLMRYVAMLALVPALARFAGWSLIGGYTPITSALAGALVGYASAFVSVLLVALIVNALARRYGGEPSFVNALKLTVYAYTPAWLAGIFLLVPGLSFLTVLGFYGIHLAWVGLQPLMRPPTEELLPYTAAVSACATALSVVLGLTQIALFGAPH
jgi:hypothetical protein